MDRSRKIADKAAEDHDFSRDGKCVTIHSSVEPPAKNPPREACTSIGTRLGSKFQDPSGRNVRVGSRAAVVARVMLRPVFPQLRKCRVSRGGYAWCHNRTFIGHGVLSATRVLGLTPSVSSSALASLRLRSELSADKPLAGEWLGGQAVSGGRNPLFPGTKPSRLDRIQKSTPVVLGLVGVKHRKFCNRFVEFAVLAHIAR
jgi:hypothetical protein